MKAPYGLALMLLVLVSASCATPMGRFYKPGVSEPDMNADHYACLQQATYPKEGMEPRVVWATVYNSCMQAKGYLKAE